MQVTTLALRTALVLEARKARTPCFHMPQAHVPHPFPPQTGNGQEALRGESTDGLDSKLLEF